MINRVAKAYFPQASVNSAAAQTDPHNSLPHDILS